MIARIQKILILYSSYNKIINFINNISCSKIKTNKLSRKTNILLLWLPGRPI
jgi:hypothetical protein